MIYSVGKTLADVEKEHIQQTLTFHGGNQTKTAQALGISVKTLYNKLSKYEETDAVPSKSVNTIAPATSK